MSNNKDNLYLLKHVPTGFYMAASNSDSKIPVQTSLDSDPPNFVFTEFKSFGDKPPVFRIIDDSEGNSEA